MAKPKLTPDQVYEARTRSELGVPLSTLAKEMGVVRSCLSTRATRERWGIPERVAALTREIIARPCPDSGAYFVPDDGSSLSTRTVSMCKVQGIWPLVPIPLNKFNKLIKGPPTRKPDARENVGEGPDARKPRKPKGLTHKNQGLEVSDAPECGPKDPGPGAECPQSNGVETTVQGSIVQGTVPLTHATHAGAQKTALTHVTDEKIHKYHQDVEDITNSMLAAVRQMPPVPRSVSDVAKVLEIRARHLGLRDNESKPQVPQINIAVLSNPQAHYSPDSNAVVTVHAEPVSTGD